MKTKNTSPVVIPIQAQYRKDEVISILQCDEESWKEMLVWHSLQYVTLEQLLSYLRSHGVKYKVTA